MPQSKKIVFADKKKLPEEEKKWKMVIADDEKGVHDTTKIVLKELTYNGSRLSFISAFSAKEAMELIENNPDTAVVLLDVVMEEDDAGLKVIKHIRETLKNDLVRIILRTGQPGYAPETKVIVKYDINDYKAKAELTSEKLFSSVVSALRSYRQLIELDNLRKELEIKNIELEKANIEIKETSDQLIQAEKLSALGEATAGVAHEVSQPLNGIKIIAQSLISDIKKDRLELDLLSQDMSEIVGLVNKMAMIIDHMRTFYRRSEGGINDKININRVLKMPFIILGEQLKNHNIEVIDRLSPELPDVLGDQIRLEQVFMNLINNAKVALMDCNKQKKRIELTTYVSDRFKSDAPSVVAEITDNGSGVREDLRKKIFEPFFTTREAGKGTGLGLSISSKIIEEHGGKIDLESEVGKGSTFRVILPCAGENK